MTRPLGHQTRIPHMTGKATVGNQGLLSRSRDSYGIIPGYTCILPYKIQSTYITRSFHISLIFRQLLYRRVTVIGSLQWERRKNRTNHNRPDWNLLLSRKDDAGKRSRNKFSASVLDFLPSSASLTLGIQTLTHAHANRPHNRSLSPMINLQFIVQSGDSQDLYGTKPTVWKTHKTFEHALITVVQHQDRRAVMKEYDSNKRDA